MSNLVHFSSKSNEWDTPRGFFALLDAEFGFTLDACATAENTCCERYFDMATDGLLQRWDGVVWMNPPYGMEIGRWLLKAFTEAQQGATVVCLIPARTDTSYWHRYVMRSSEIRFVRGRLRFSGAKLNAPFPCAVVVFRPGEQVPKVSAINRVLDGPEGQQRFALIA